MKKILSLMSLLLALLMVFSCAFADGAVRPVEEDTSN